MAPPPRLTDRAALARNRARAGDMTLRRAVIAEVQERLTEVNRRFTGPAIVTPFPALWADVLPGAVTVEDAEVLDLREGAHDLVLHDLCLHWADDPTGQLIQCRRALRPDGLMIATLCAGQSLFELRSALAEAEAAVSGGLSPRVLPMADLRDLGALLQRAGFAMPVADLTPVDLRYDNAWRLMRDIRAAGEGNALAGRLRRFTGRRLLARAAEIHARHHGDGPRIRATVEIATLTGWAPGDGQPVPLRPGSVARRLDEALRAALGPLDGPAD